MSNLGPLTTTFTAPASCAASTGITIKQESGAIWWAEGPIDLSTSTYPCFPSSYNPTTKHYYSPGLCPSGYTAACQSLAKSDSTTETVQTCCPTALGYDYGCVDATWDWQTFLGCTFYESTTVSQWFDFPTVTSVDVDGNTYITSTARSEVGIGAYGVEVRWQSTDFTTTTSATSTSSSAASGSTTSAISLSNAATSTGSSASSAAATGSSSAAASSGSGGLSTGAAAGIGAGVAIAGIAVLAGAFWLIRRSKKRKELKAEAAAAGTKNNNYDNNHHGPGARSHELPHETTKPWTPAEMYAPPTARELPLTTPPVYYELPDGSSRGTGQQA